jgi:hypothetical protein
VIVVVTGGRSIVPKADIETTFQFTTRTLLLGFSFGLFGMNSLLRAHGRVSGFGFSGLVDRLLQQLMTQNLTMMMALPREIVANF